MRIPSFLKSLYLSSVLCVPFLTNAAGVTSPKDFRGLVDMITSIIETLIVLTFALTFLVLMWSIVKSWIIDGGNAESVDEGKKVVVTGIIVLVVMCSVWGIVYMLKVSLFGNA